MLNIEFLFCLYLYLFCIFFATVVKIYFWLKKTLNNKTLFHASFYKFGAVESHQKKLNTRRWNFQKKNNPKPNMYVRNFEMDLMF